MKIITNNIPRPLVYGYELPENQRREFDYLSDEEYYSSVFVKYKGQYYDLLDFTKPFYSKLIYWDGLRSDSFFSGILIKVLPSSEYVIIGRYIV